MSGMYFLFPTLLAILFSFLVVRGAAVALMMTGMEKKRARTGFTTKEAESVVNHPQRRKVFIYKGFLRRMRCLSG